MSCPSIFTGDTITISGVAPEGSASDSIVLPIPDWPTSRKTNSSTKILDILDGGSIVFGGDEYFTRQNNESRELVFNLNYTKKEQLFTFLKSYIGKRVTIDGFLETSATKFVIASPIIEIEETLRASFLEMVNPVTNYSIGASSIDVTKFATLSNLQGMLDLKVRFYATGVPVRDYDVLSLSNVNSTTDNLKIAPTLDSAITTATRVTILNKCPLYRLKFTVIRTTQL